MATVMPWHSTMAVRALGGVAGDEKERPLSAECEEVTGEHQEENRERWLAS